MRINQKLLQHYLNNYSIKKILMNNNEITKLVDTNGESLWEWEKHQDLIYSLQEDDTYSVKAVSSSRSSFQIPATYNNKPVTKIEDRAFENNTYITEMIIPSSITYIGDYAFAGCSELKYYYGYDKEDVFYCADLKYIGAHAFENCTNFEWYGEFPSSLEEIGDYAFANTLLTDDITFGVNSKLIRIGEGAFYNCGDIGSIILPDSLAELGDYAFYNCISLTEIDIPDGVTYIGDYAFYNSLSKTSGVDLGFTLRIPLNATYIGDYAFYNSIGIGEVYISKKVTKIGDYAFAGCVNIKNINFRGDGDISLKTIGECAFRDNFCASITVPQSVTEIGFNAFGTRDKEKLPNVVTEITLPFVGQYANHLLKGNGYLGWIFGTTKYDEQNNYVPSTLKQITVTGNNECYLIQALAFANCKNITSITFTDKITNIQSHLCQNCTSLSDIQLNNITYIGNWAFENCTNLKSIQIPSAVNNIGIGIFTGCTALTYIGLECNIWIRNKQTIVIPDGAVQAMQEANGSYDLTRGELTAAPTFSTTVEKGLPVGSTGTRNYDLITITVYNPHDYALTIDGNISFMGNTQGPSPYLNKPIGPKETITILTGNTDPEGIDTTFATTTIQLWFEEYPWLKSETLTVYGSEYSDPSSSTT